MGYDIIGGSMEYLDRSMQKYVSANKAKYCVKEIWSMLISILKGQNDSFTSIEDMIFFKQQSFVGKSKDLFVFVERNDKMDWQFVRPDS